MARDICGKTKVTINGTEIVCDTFPQVWQFMNDNGIEVEEKTKEYIIRVLFINSKMDLNDFGADVQLEIVWED